MKYSIVIFIAILFSCNSNQSQNTIDMNLLRNVKSLPDENFYPRGDSIFSMFLSKGKKITPELIEKISDTISSKCNYTSNMNYKTGDIAILVLKELYDYREFPLKEIIIKNFYLDTIEKKDYQLTVLYDKILLFNSHENNYKNRLNLKKAIEGWFENQ